MKIKFKGKSKNVKKEGSAFINIKRTTLGTVMRMDGVPDSMETPIEDNVSFDISDFHSVHFISNKSEESEVEFTFS